MCSAVLNLLESRTLNKGVNCVLQIRYGIREHAMTAIDMIARRLRLAFLNVQAAQEALPGVIDIMAEELKWTKEEKEVNICKSLR